MTIEEIKANYPAFLKYNGVSEPTVVRRAALRPIPDPTSLLGVKYEIVGEEELCGHPRATMESAISTDQSGKVTCVNTCGLCGVAETHSWVWGHTQKAIQ